VPDATTIWLFREHLSQARAVGKLFARFDKYLTKAGYLAIVRPVQWVASPGGLELVSAMTCSSIV